MEHTDSVQTNSFNIDCLNFVHKLCKCRESYFCIPDESNLSFLN